MAWMSGPTTLCRHNLLLSLLEEVKPRQILEIGFGNGDLLLKMNAKGYRGLGLDFSEAAVQAFEEKNKSKALQFKVRHGSAEQLLSSSHLFDLVIACEVLEHIKDDVATLQTWGKLLLPRGSLLLSVPAHMSQWGSNDEYAGHIRRYEREELIRKLTDAGYYVEYCYSYGYPISNLAHVIGDRLIRKNIKNEASQEERTKESGIHNVHFPLGSLLINNVTMQPFYLLQRIFMNTDKGIGYVVLAKRKG